MAVLENRIVGHSGASGGRMGRFRAAAFALILAAAAAPAAAEKTVQVNDPASPGVFDQPSAAVSGSVVHVAFIGGGGTAGPFRIHYAAINGAADFTNLSLTRDTPGFMVTPPTPVDNTDAGNDPYADARHPRIAMRSPAEAIIFFQARPAASADPTYVLYLAILALDNNTVVKQTVRMVQGIDGFNEDVSFGLVAADNTARVAYAGRNGFGDRFDVFYARVSLDDAAVTGAPGVPLLLSAAAGTDGSRPIPSLKLDGLNRAHVAWAANDDSSSANGIHYALVKEVGGADNVAIAATEVLGRSRKWGHPNVLVSSPQSVIVLAADESVPGVAGALGMVTVNPDADDQDGSSVQVPTNTSFFLTPPGEAVLGDAFSLFRPEAFLDLLGNVHLTGYGNNTRSTYFAFRPLTAFPFAQFVTNPAKVGLDSPELPVSLPDDYSRAALAFLSGKVLVFWSGEAPGSSTRNLDVTGLPTVTAVPFEESGCSAAAAPAGNRGGGVSRGVLLLLPAALLAVLRRVRRPVEK
jgi:hypothetical protein